MAVMHGADDKTVPGNALTVAPGSPFGGLKFQGNNFLQVRGHALFLHACPVVCGGGVGHISACRGGHALM